MKSQSAVLPESAGNSNTSVVGHWQADRITIERVTIGVLTLSSGPENVTLTNSAFTATGGV
jgi:hypothetical protein